MVEEGKITVETPSEIQKKGSLQEILARIKSNPYIFHPVPDIIHNDLGAYPFLPYFVQKAEIIVSPKKFTESVEELNELMKQVVGRELRKTEMCSMASDGGMKLGHAIFEEEMGMAKELGLVKLVLWKRRRMKFLRGLYPQRRRIIVRIFPDPILASVIHDYDWEVERGERDPDWETEFGKNALSKEQLDALRDRNLLIPGQS
ncbi:MAG: hypothetical protein A2W22_05730 [Candidatus Levybacteria bacterium RBG_16_35_11]|nr:MAG: hypothetical protein A2W22_05730 [Candidatus Levybacteria bacterium RBG_16_35_11]